MTAQAPIHRHISAAVQQLVTDSTLVQDTLYHANIRRVRRSMDMPIHQVHRLDMPAVDSIHRCSNTLLMLDKLQVQFLSKSKLFYRNETAYTPAHGPAGA
jgi:excinuclease UvrABC ATPase subunit